MISLDGQPQDWFPAIGASQPEIMARMQRICAPVPSDVELGIHFCYGDFGAKHFIEPKDSSRMVDVANDIGQRGRPGSSITCIFRCRSIGPTGIILLRLRI